MILNSIFNTPSLQRFSAPACIVSERGIVSRIANFLDSTFPSVLIFDVALESLAKTISDGLEIHCEFPCTGEPMASEISDFAKFLSDFPSLNIIGVGGGSIIDRAKALSLGRSTGIWHRVGYHVHREVAELSHTQDRVIVVPTLPGSGAETSRYIVLSDSEGRKLPSRSWVAVPDVVLLDLEVVKGAPRDLLFKGAFDAFVHAWETLISVGEYSRLLAQSAREVLATTMDFVESLEEDLMTDDKLASMMWASSVGGILISNTRVGLMHTLGESTARYIPISHPESLALFFREVASTYDQQHVESRTQRSLPEAVVFWENAWNQVGLNRNTLSRVPTSDLVAMVLEDRVLVQKEHPGRLNQKILTTLIERART